MSKTPSQTVCPNCGAEIEKSDPKCPFCGFINAEGAEKKYMDRLYDMRNDLDSVDEEAAQGYEKGYGRIGRMILITLAILIIVTGTGYVIYRASLYKELRHEPEKSSDMLKEMTWRKEAFKEFDRLYEEGEYKKLCDAVFSPENKDHSSYEWEHYRFAEIYNDYLMTIRDLKRIDREGWSQYDAGAVFYRCCLCYYDDVYKNAYGNSLSDEDIEKLRPAIDYMNGVLHDRLNFTDEDMAGFRDSIVGKYHNIEYDKCVKTGRAHMDRFK
ncbi:MAG: zinc ribbon domain-containing protein [Lachnospiraceae bacterium]|nr:zinc ribbon domain-containing protein [Lachnospiraceae bacterium]